MKRIFKSKLTYLILLFILNIVCIVVICVATVSKFSYPQPYVISSSNQIHETILSKSYKVYKDDIEECINYDASIKKQEDMICSYELDTCTINKFTEVKENDLLGTIGDNSIYASSNGYCLDVNYIDNKYEISIYNYNKFNIVVTLSSNEYLANNFSKDKKYYLVIDEKKYIANFKEYNLTKFYSNNTIYAYFYLNECNDLINESTNCSLEMVREVLENVFYIDANAFDNQINSRKFVYLDGNEYKNLILYTSKIINGKAIIESSSIVDGMILYVE